MKDLTNLLVSDFEKIHPEMKYYITPKDVRSILVELNESKYKTVLDPVCGLGSILTDLYVQDPNKTYLGIDINNKLIMFLKNFLNENNVDIELDSVNLLNRDEDVKSTDLLVADLPMGNLINKEIANDYEINSRESSVIFLQRLLELSNADGRIAVLIPSGFLSKIGKPHQSIRDKIIKSHHLSAVIELPSGMLAPHTGVQTSVLIIDKKHSNKHVYFAKIKEHANQHEIKDVMTVFKSDGKIKHKGCFWVDYKDIQDVWTYNYYDPQLRSETSKLREEKTVSLSEVASIIKPRKTVSTLSGKVIKTKNFHYPVDVKNFDKEQVTSVRLQVGDILMSESFSGNTKYFLINELNDDECYASTFLTVIRPTSKLINSEYLFLYLQSNVVQKYLEIYQVGVHFKRLRKKDLEGLPVIIPDKNVQIRSISLFVANFTDRRPKTIQDINKELFSKKLTAQPIQKEFLIEELEELRVWKKEIIEKILKDDLRELKLSKENELYKSFLILAGSLLEAYLLDWICEIENKDYFSNDKDKLTLGSLIWKKLKLSVPNIDQKLLSKAENIRLKRNLIHPKEYFNTEFQIDDKTCDEIIADLKYIFDRRTKIH